MLYSQHLKSTQFTAELSSQWCHFDFPVCTKKKTKKPNSYSTAHIRFILLGSAYGTFLFYYNSVCTRIFSFRTEWKWQMTKCIFLANTQEHKCTSANGIWVKYIYIERDCCVVNSCHLYVLNLCVSNFVVIVELAVIFCLKMDLIFQRSDYGCHINCCWFFGIVIKGVGKYCFVYIQSIYRLC